jgi:hypothetical protein
VVIGTGLEPAGDLLRATQYEFQVAAVIKACPSSERGLTPNNLNELFVVTAALSLEDIFCPHDPLANLDSKGPTSHCVPVGVVHVFRQLFFDWRFWVNL